MNVTSDDIYRMMIRGDIHVNLSAAPLAEPGLVHIFPDAQSASAIAPIASRPLIPKITSLEVREGTRFLWDDRTWMIANVGEKNIWLYGERGDSSIPHELFDKYVNQNLIQVIETQSTEGDSAYAKGLELFHNARPSEQKEAERRLKVILPYINGEKKLNGVKKERSIWRWISDYKEALDVYDYGLAGLLPDYSGRGNSNKRLLEAVYRIMDDRIKNDYETPQQKSMLAVWGLVLKDCESQGIPEDKQPSYPTFTKRVNKCPLEEQTEKRRGKRAAYKHKPFVYWIEHDTPRHGDRPFHIVHADHTKLDVELVCPITGENFGRPWASFLVDAYSRRLLAVVVTFDPPSYRSVMMLLRECVRRHNRLPQILVVDRGREFDNNYFRKLAGAFEITIKVRPKAEPRFGSTCERLFGIANDQFVHLLTGNTQIMNCVREVTKSVNPKNLAAWTLGDFTQWFCAWAYIFHDQQPHWTLKQSPAIAYARSVELTGKRRRLITYNETFRIRAMPTTRKGTAKNVVDKGVKINNIYYRCHELHDRELEGKQLAVRYDPFDISTAYVLIRNKWVRCLSEHYTTFQYCTERQLRIASQEIRKKNQKLLKGRPLSAKQLADFISGAERVQTELASKRLLLQRRRDGEFRPLMRFIDSATGEMYFAPLPPHAKSTASVSDGLAAAGQTADTDFPTRSGINLDEIQICEELR
jgi:transposase InsO family protein